MVQLKFGEFLTDKKPARVAIHTNPMAIGSPPNKRQNAALAQATSNRTIQRDIRGVLTMVLTRSCSS